MHQLPTISLKWINLFSHIYMPAPFLLWVHQKNDYPPCQLIEWNQYTLMHVCPILFLTWVHHTFNAVTKGTSGHVLPTCVFTCMHFHMHAFPHAYFCSFKNIFRGHPSVICIFARIFCARWLLINGAFSYACAPTWKMSSLAVVCIVGSNFFSFCSNRELPIYLIVTWLWP